MSTSFRASPNALFDTRVSVARRISPRFVRITLTGPSLLWFAPTGRDQRIKILMHPSRFT